MNTFFVIISPKKNEKLQPRVWTGRGGWSDVHFLAHQYLTAEKANAAISRNKLTGAKYMTYEEYERDYVN